MRRVVVSGLEYRLKTDRAQVVKHGEYNTMTTTETTLKAPTTPAQAWEAFAAWIAQKPGLDPRDYFSSYSDANGRRAYRDDARTISQQKRRALDALGQAQLYPYDAAEMAEALRSGFSGRLTWDTESQTLEYCTGQYWPTEYRIAAAVVLERYTEAVRPKSAPLPGAKFQTIEAIKTAARVAGSHFFDASTMRFFASKTLPDVFNGPGGIFFITSEKKCFNDYTRVFTVRRFKPEDADVITVEGCYQMPSAAIARTAARRCAASPAPEVAATNA